MQDTTNNALFIINSLLIVEHYMKQVFFLFRPSIFLFCSFYSNVVTCLVLRRARFVDNVFITFFPLRRCFFWLVFCSFFIVNYVSIALAISSVIVLKCLVDMYCHTLDP